MMITSKGRNALKVMIDLAQHNDGTNISLTDISARVGESLKYLEACMSQLSSAGLVVSQRGKGGGYKLAKAPQDYTVAEIIVASEGSLAPVSCLDSSTPCERADCCLTLPLWKELDDVIMSFLKSKKLSELLN